MNQAKTEETTFCDALELPPERRAEFIRSACAGDRKLQSAVENLLKINDTDNDFLATPETG